VIADPVPVKRVAFGQREGSEAAADSDRPHFSALFESQGSVPLIALPQSVRGTSTTLDIGR
jgi:hypothetical protein